MPNDTQIFSGAVRDGHSDYELPGSSEIRVKAVHATFTDNGAGADWCPAVVMISDSAHKITTALLPDVKVTAGDDAEVSWFPGVKPTTATPFSSSSLHWCKVVCGTASPPAGPITIASFDTNDPGNYVQVSANTWTIPNFPQVVIGYTNPSAAITTNGSITGGVRASSGYTIYGSAGTGVAVQILPFVDLLQSGFELSSPWRAELNGSDTHQWSVHVSYFYVG